MTVIALRPVTDSDLGQLFDQMRDPESVRMAAFTPDDPNDRTAFDAHMARVRSSPGITLRAVTCDNQLVGSISAFVLDARPLHARAASDNTGSLRVLQKSGFKVIGTENSYAPGRNSNIEETILRKD